MALITSYSEDNRVIDSGLTVTYSRELVSGTWVGESLVASAASNTYYFMWEYHRRATKSYRYVGMTDAAKDECLADMIELYTRNVRASFWNSTTSDGHGLGSWSEDSAGQIVVADISPVHNEDGSWDVVVNVREDDVRMRKTWNVVSPSTLFATEQQRGYDGETE